MKLPTFLTPQKRCKHRHTKEEHPQCFPMDTKDGNILPKVLVFDIETSPMQVFVWHLHEQRISSESVISDFYLLSWSAKWLFSNEIMSDVLTSKEAINQDDKRIANSIWKLLNEADVVIAHNANGFDIPKLNTRFLYHDMLPPMPYRVIDTLTVARSKFKISSNKLSYLAKFLGVQEKLGSGYALWKDCFKGDKEALKSMVEYNRGDIETLEDIYVKIRPWIKSHPNMGLYVETDKPVCPICASTELDWRGTYPSNGNVFKAFRCKGCGAVGRGKDSILAKQKLKSLTTT